MQTLQIQLDESQEAAVRAVALTAGLPRLQLVFGPPGTGKSSTLVAALYMLVARGARVLVCAPSNEAVDLIVKRFLPVLARAPAEHAATVAGVKKRGGLLRVQAAGRHPAFVDPDVLSISPRKNEAGSGFERPLRTDVASARVVFTTCVSACTIPMTDDGLGGGRGGGFDCILIDEAGNTCETESLIPLALATPRTTRFALFGDWQQLRPVVVGHEKIDDVAPFLTAVAGEMADRVHGRTERVAEGAQAQVEAMLPEEAAFQKRDRASFGSGEEWEVLDEEDIVFQRPRGDSVTPGAAAAAAAAAPGDGEAVRATATATATAGEENDRDDDQQQPPPLPRGFAHWIGVNPRVSLLERCHLEAQRDQHEDERQLPLTVSYRMDPGVCDMVSRMFYEGALRSHSAHNAQDLPFLRDLDFDLLGRLPAWDSVRRAAPGEPGSDGTRMFFLDTSGEETREKGSPSWFNLDEVLRVYSLVAELAKSAVAAGRRVTVAVLSPYRKQTTKIKAMLRKAPNVELLDDPRNRYGRNRQNVLTAAGVVAQIGSAEMLQGQEADVVVVSTVRSSSAHFADDRRFALGFVADPKRMNVAISRARYLVVVIGSKDTLSIDPTWNRFIVSCEMQGALMEEEEVVFEEGSDDGSDDA